MSLASLSVVLGTKPSADANVPPTPAGYRAWVRARLAEPQIYEAFTPRITKLGTTQIGVTGFLGGPLKSERGREYYFHDANRCSDEDLVPVRPWWAPNKEILICKNDYRPERIVGKHGTACDMNWGAIHPIQECGCGPNLLFCAPMSLRDALSEALVQEVRDTVRHVVEKDRPFDDILTTNETVRNGKADYWYNRVEFFRTGSFEAPNVETPPRLVKRPEYFGGGILSSFPVLFADGPRSNTENTWADFLCTPLRSASVVTERVVEVAHGLAEKEADLRAEPVLELAQTEGCQNCHARLEYGSIARGAWLPNLYGQHLSSAKPKFAKTRFYVRSHEDLRAEGPATLAWLGQTIVKQPEFPRCMTTKVANWVYEGQSPPADVMSVLLARFEGGHNMRQLIEDAVVARAFGKSGLDAVHRGPAE